MSLNDCDPLKRPSHRTKRIFTLILLLIAGGEGLSDIQLLQADRSLKRLLGWSRLPAATTLGQFLHRCTRRALGALSTVSTRLATKTIQRRLIRAMTLDFDATLTEPLIEAAKAIPEKEWRYFDRTDQLAETVHVVGEGARAYRAIVLRTKLEQPDIFTGLYSYHVVMTNASGRGRASIIRWHRQRAKAENIIKEL